MSTLSNVETGRGQANPPSVRVAPDTIPEAKSSQTGVSVRYVPTPDKHWFVFRASYGREDKAFDYIVADGTFAYIAKRYVRKTVNGKQKKVLETLIPNLLFVYTTDEKASEYVKNTPPTSFLSYYYNHFRLDENQKNPPLTISNEEMENFIIATCNQSEHLKFVTESQCHFKGGETVEVIDGMFKGVVGRVARVSGQQRVVISLTDVGLILLSPLFLVLAIWIKSDSKGPVFYRQVRVGRYNRDFRIFKFRSMRAGSDTGSLITIGGRDPRITRSGYLIRKFKFDELPQLINVLIGDMSLVGPRPEVRHYVNYWTPEQMHVLDVRPGITDPASIIFLNENELLEKAEDPEKYYIEVIMQEKIKLYLQYVEKQSFLYDITLIFKTFWMIVTRESE